MTDLTELLILTAIGRLFIFLWMQFPMPDWFENSKYGKLHHCTLCSGVWIYSIVFLVFGLDLVSMLGLPRVMYMGEILSGGIISYLMFLLEFGFREYFMGIVIE